MQAEDRDMTMPGLLEVPAGRTNITVQLTPDMEEFGRVEASWLFSCAGLFTDPEDGNGSLTTRFCDLQCRDHDDSDSISELDST